MPKTAILLIILALIAFEAWRLSNDETVRLRQTWQFTTSDGPLVVSDVLELRQGAAIPYLPGGEVGKAETIGRIPVSFRISGKDYFISSEPRSLIGNAARAGKANPPVSMDGLRNEYTTGFIRRLRRANTTITITATEMSAFEREKIVIASELYDWGGLKKSKSLSDFEAEHPGFRLLSVTYKVTKEPVDR
ncbi:MAG: hypothetical protein ACOY7T_15075 [Pseudomonadota bacterium]